MLPILPALLLLILQGPSSIERMALDGRLPAALEAVSRQMDSQDRRLESVENAEAAVWASLLAFGGDPDLSSALLKLLALEVSEELPRRDLGVDHADWVDPPEFPTSDSAKLPDACIQCRRTRDGPH